MISRVSIVFQ